jgi:hypothetical protein
MIAMKGKKAVTSLVPADGGYLIMVVTCMNVAGHIVPLLVEFPKENKQIESMCPS